MVLIEVALLSLVVGIIWTYFYRLSTYWERRNVKTVKSNFILGSFTEFMFQRKSFGENCAEFYKNSNEKILGAMSLNHPIIIVRDPEIISNVFSKDFKYFYHRGIHFDVKNDPTTLNLLMTNGERWKLLREKLSPTFASGKLKAMFDRIVESGKSLYPFIETYAEGDKPLEFRDLFARYATNIIASVAFGIEVDCIKNRDEAFRIQGKKIFDLNLRNAVRGIISSTSPFLSKLFKIRFTDCEVQEFMTDIVKQNIEYREKNGVFRKDFFQLLMSLYKTGDIRINDDWKEIKEIANESKKFTLEEIMAQAFFFFAASFETSSATMSFCLYELARNQDAQKKLQKEIDDAGELTYETIESMKYLDQCIDG